MIHRIAMVLGLALAVGCSKPTAAPAPTSPDIPLAVPNKAAPGPEAGQFARDFLAALHEGKATAAQLTPTFKKAIAEPVFDADRALGYSDSAAELWLKTFQGKVGGFTLSSPRIDTVALYTGTVKSEKPLQLLLRLVRRNDRWTVDWFSLAEIAPTDTTPAVTSQSFTASAFLHGLLGHRYELAAGAMSTRLKKSLAPALGSETKPFNTGTLTIKLDEYRGTARGYTLAKAEGETAIGELIHANGKKAFALKLVAGEHPDEWLVDEIKLD